MKFISWNVNGLRAVLSKGFEDIFKQLDEFAEETEKKNKYRKIYSRFENFPSNVKKTLFIMKYK